MSAALQHPFSNRWIGHAKLGYLDNDNIATGGRTSFRAPLA